MSVKVIVHVRKNDDGSLPQVDIWGDAIEFGYSAADEFFTVVQYDAQGRRRRKSYGCGQYAAISVMPGGGEDRSQIPADAETA